MGLQTLIKPARAKHSPPRHQKCFNFVRFQWGINPISQPGYATAFTPFNSYTPTPNPG